MAFPTIPTAAAGRVVTGVQANTTATRTFPSLTGLTKNSGDLLVAIIVCYQSSLTSAIFSAWGAGFTEIRDIGVASQHCIGVAYKFSDGTETGTFTVAQAGTITGHAAMIVLSIPGAHASTAPEVSAALATGTSANADPASLNPAGWDVEDTLWIAVRGSGETSTTGSFTGLGNPATNYTNSAQTGISQDAVGGVEAGTAFRQLAAASEDVGAGSADTSNARNCAFVIAVRPAAVEEHSGSVTATGGGVAVISAVKQGIATITATGGGVAVLTQTTARLAAVTGTGGGVAATASTSAHVGAATATGGGAAATTGAKAAFAAETATGGGVAEVTSLASRVGAVQATGAGVATLASSGAHVGSAVATGGGSATLAPSSGRSGSVGGTGGGVASLSVTSARLAAALMSGGGVMTSLQTTERFASVTATGGGIATVSGGQASNDHSGSVTATGGGIATLQVTTARGASVTATGGGMAVVSGGVVLPPFPDDATATVGFTATISGRVTAPVGTDSVVLDPIATVEVTE